MHILVDTREHLSLQFSHPNIDGICTQTLSVGDYGCRFKNGYIPPVYFERKSLSDLTGTLTSGIDRFKRELERAKESNVQLILIIECTLSKAQKGTEYSSVNPLSIIKTVFTLFVKYGLIPVFCKNREEMAFYIAEYYSAIGRNALKEFGKSWNEYLPKEHNEEAIQRSEEYDETGDTETVNKENG